MKAFFRGLVVVLLLVGCGKNSKGGEAGEGSTNSVADTILVKLRDVADVELKKGKGEPKSGQLTAIDPKSQELTISLSGSSAKIPIVDIKKVTFRNGIETVGGNGFPIRGDQKADQKTWRSIPLSEFKIQDANPGEAELTQPSLVNEAESSLYLLEEMQFESEPPGKMALKVTSITD